MNSSALIKTVFFFASDCSKKGGLRVSKQLIGMAKHVKTYVLCHVFLQCKAQRKDLGLSNAISCFCLRARFPLAESSSDHSSCVDFWLFRRQRSLVLHFVLTTSLASFWIGLEFSDLFILGCFCPHPSLGIISIQIVCVRVFVRTCREGGGIGELF